MNPVIVIQARMSSTRFPGKVLAPLAGTTVLGYMLENLKPLGIPIVVATPSSEVEIRLEAERHDVEWFGGNERDVLERVVQAVRWEHADATHVVRLTADCPLVSAKAVGAFLKRAAEPGEPDYVSNVVARTFADGIDIEVIKTDVLREADANSVDPVEREHVTPYIYRHPRKYVCWGVLQRGTPYPWVRLTVDHPEDLKPIQRVIDGKMWEKPAPDPVLVPAYLSDMRDFWECRNQSGWYEDQVSYGDHMDWFMFATDHLEFGNYSLFSGGQFAGYFRIRVDCGIGSVSCALYPEFRGKGLGTWGLNELSRLTWPQCKRLRARVNRGIPRSEAVFLKAGYEPVQEAFKSPAGQLYVLDR